MASTDYSITTAAYEDLGAGPATIVRKTAGRLWVYFGPSSPGDNDASFILDSKDEGFDYGGSDNIYLKADDPHRTPVTVIKVE